MPTFNLAPKPENLDPQWDQAAPQSMGNGKVKPTKAQMNQRLESAAGPLQASCSADEYTWPALTPRLACSPVR